MSRLDSPFLGEFAGTFTTTDGTPTGATPGEMAILASTTLPTDDPDSAQFIVAGLDEGRVQLAGPRALSMGARLSGSASPTATVRWRLMGWHPQAARWYPTSLYTTIGDDNLDDDTQTAGGIYFAMWPRWAILGMIHVPNLPADVVLHATVSRDKQ